MSYSLYDPDPRKRRHAWRVILVWLGVLFAVSIPGLNLWVFALAYLLLVWLLPGAIVTAVLVPAWRRPILRGVARWSGRTWRAMNGWPPSTDPVPPESPAPPEPRRLDGPSD